MKSTKRKSKSKQTSTSRYNSHFSKCFTIRKEKEIAGNIINIINAAAATSSHWRGHANRALGGLQAFWLGKNRQNYAAGNASLPRRFWCTN